MSILKFVLDSRGPVNLVKRTAQIVNRFGSGPERMGGRFERFMDVLDEFDIRPTFPITALPMSRNPRFAHRLVDRGAELAVHAWSHVDLSALSYDQQHRHMGDAIGLFNKHKVPFTGFRAPYLHWNEDTMRVVADYDFFYSSNQTVMWDVIDLQPLSDTQRDGFEKGRRFYQPKPADSLVVLPYLRDGFVEIPVSLPDDEIMLDRMYMHDASFLGDMWEAILQQSYERGELFTLQLHPERIDFFTPPLRKMLARARELEVWIATLDEIARWWRARRNASFEFTLRGDVCDVTFGGPDLARATIRDGAGEWVEPPGTFTMAATRRPVIGVADDSNAAATEQLRNMGYVVEACGRDACTLHLGKVDGAGVDTLRACLRTIAESGAPLVRVATWPEARNSALAVTGDIDALTIWDFVHRFRGA